MALPASGAISLSDVNSNIGASSTAGITLNDTAVHWLANGDATSTPVAMSSLYGKSWSWTSNSTKTNFFGVQAVATDSSGYTYFTCYSGYGLFVFKLNPVGVVVWITQITANSSYSLGGTFKNGLAVSAAGNVYLSVAVRVGSSAYYYGACKLNSSGTLQWSSFLTVGAALNFGENGTLGIDSSENVYSKAFQEFDGTGGGIIGKWNSSGTLQYQKKIELTYGTIGNGGLFVDSTNNYIYYCGLGNPTTNGILIKYDTNLSQQWGTYLYTASGCRIDAVTTNTSNQNVYVAVGSPVTGIAKYNSSGTLQWQKQLQYGANYMAIAADTSDNAYVEMNRVDSSCYIIKVNSSGAISSQLEFSPVGTSSGVSGGVMSGVALTGNSVVSAMSTYNVSTYDGASGIKILNSLSTTGTYGRVTMSSSSIAAVNTSYTTGSTTPTVSTTSYSTASSLVTGTDVTSSFTKTVTLI